MGGPCQRQRPGLDEVLTVVSKIETTACEGAAALRHVSHSEHRNPLTSRPHPGVTSNDQVTDAGLKDLAGLKSLEVLHLGNTKVTGAGLKELAGLESLQALYLYDTPLTDAGLKHLAALKSLRYLNLAHCSGVTDAGLKDLGALKSLKYCFGQSRLHRCVQRARANRNESRPLRVSGAFL